MVSNLALFCLATYLATFQKIGRFFPNHLVILPPNDTFRSSLSVWFKNVFLTFGFFAWTLASIFFGHCKENSNLKHGQTVVSRTKLGPSF
jgi:hypothetical protein